MTDVIGTRPETRVRLRSIALQRLDGQRATATVRSFPEADEVLCVWAQTAPEHGKGYHRVAYLLVFEDGQECRELYHLNRSDGQPVSLARSVRGHLEAVARRHYAKADRDDESRRRLLSPHRDPRGTGKQAAALLDGYAFE